jgi:hypothetical protein
MGRPARKMISPVATLAQKALVIPFPDQYEIRREAADGAVARQSEVTTYRIDVEME